MSIYGTMEKVCPDCNGTGKRPEAGSSKTEEDCVRCGGEGIVTARSSQAAILSARNARRKQGR